MKKINLFNKTISPLSDGKGCPVERGGVWCIPFPWERGPAEQPGGMGITPSPLSPTKFLKFCGTRFGATPSWKEGERKVPSYRRMPVSRGFNRGGGIPLFSGMTAVIFALFVATPSFATPTELDKKTVASKAYVDTKQDKITTGNIMFYDDPEETDIYVPGLVAYDPQTSALSGNKIGILDQETILRDEGNLSFYSNSGGGYGSEMDNFVPTVRAVAEGLARKQDLIPAAWTSPTSIYAMASTGGLTIELGADAGIVGRRYITAGGSQPLTQKTGADNVILYINGTKTLAEYQTSNFGATGNIATINQNYINGALVSLELLKDVYSELNAKITNNALPTGTTGTVVTYNGANAETGVQEFSERAVYDPENTYNAQTDATKLATAGFVETKQNKMTCAGWDSDTHTDEHCWLWSIE